MNIKTYNGIELPIIGYGTFPQKEELISNVDYAIKCGYTLIDTSDNYFNEEYVGNALQTIADKNIRVVSKFSTLHRSLNVKECFEESKAKLNGRCDIYLLHWPYPFIWRRVWKQMEDLYLNGECKAIGVCNFEIKHLKRLLRMCRVRPMINQIEIHPDFQQRGVVEFCQKQNIVVMAYSPLARQNDKLMCDSTLKGIAKEYNRSINQIILKWIVSKGIMPIPGSSNKTHIQENIEIFDFELSNETISKIDLLESGNRVRSNPNDWPMWMRARLFYYWFFRRSI